MLDRGGPTSGTSPSLNKFNKEEEIALMSLFEVSLNKFKTLCPFEEANERQLLCF
jgi:hypothetical protein